MGKDDCIEVEGRVIEPLPNAMFRVELDNGHKVLAHVSGKTVSYTHLLAGHKLPIRTKFIIKEEESGGEANEG